MQFSRLLMLGAAALLMVFAAACAGDPNLQLGEVQRRAPGGDAETGRRLAQFWGCGSCHNIPGVPGANSMVAAPLDNYSQRHYIAGALLNNADNLTAWIRNPQAIEPGTAMPNLGMSEQEARHIAAYLYSLRR